MSTSSSECCYTIGGVKVEFPMKPYPTQMAMMGQIIRGLKKSQNCLLESPTGSGKSLALLCSTLAWLQLETERIQAHNELIQHGIVDPEVLSRVANGIAVSREETTLPTRSQVINQASPVVLDTDRDGGFIRSVNYSLDDSTLQQPELINLDDSGNPAAVDMSGVFAEDDRMTAYLDQAVVNRPRTIKIPKIFFGTRTHKQLHQIIRELRRTKYKDVRSLVLGSREYLCIHPVVSRERNKNERCKNMRDNVDGEFCSFHHAASYFKNFQELRSRTKTSETVFDIEDMVKFGKKQKACPYYITRHLLDDAEIIFCPYNYLIDPLIRDAMMLNLKGHVVILDEAHNCEDSSREAASASLDQVDMIEAQKDLERLMSHQVKPASCDTLANMLHSLAMWMDSNLTNLNDYQEYGRSGRIFSGKEMTVQLKSIDIHPGRLKELQGCLADLVEEPSDAEKQENIPKPISGTCLLLKNLLLMFNYIFKDNMKHAPDYQVALLKQQEFGKFAEKKGFNGWLSRAKAKLAFKYTLNFWCLNPGVAFSEVGDVTRSIILTSGTLSPMNSFESELRVKFPIKMEANHVIKADQVWIGTLSRGPTNIPLNGTYRHSETWDFQDELGRSILEICKSVPRGVLCFLPSYSMMNKLIERWQSTKIWDEFDQYKYLITEKRRAEEFEDSMRVFEDALARTRNCNPGEQNGVLFFAVCRGKVSEGMDFSDDNARAVITVGIPFPNVKDIQVDLKKKYNNIHCKSLGLLSGNEWYEIQAFRALNQALGRCLRHRYDWGALILIDERYQFGSLNGSYENKYIKSLSKWVRRSILHHRDFNDAMKRLKQFSEHMTENPPSMSVLETTNSSVCLTSNNDSNPNTSDDKNNHENKDEKNDNLDISIIGGIGFNNEVELSSTLETSVIGPSSLYLQGGTHPQLSSTQISQLPSKESKSIAIIGIGESPNVNVTPDSVDISSHVKSRCNFKEKNSQMRQYPVKVKIFTKSESNHVRSTGCVEGIPSGGHESLKHKRRRKSENLVENLSSVGRGGCTLILNSNDSFQKEYSCDDDLFVDSCTDVKLVSVPSLITPDHSSIMKDEKVSSTERDQTKMKSKNTRMASCLNNNSITLSDGSDLEDFQTNDVSFSTQSIKKKLKSKKRKGVIFSDY